MVSVWVDYLVNHPLGGVFFLTFVPANLYSDPSQTSNEGMFVQSLFGGRHMHAVCAHVKYISNLTTCVVTRGAQKWQKVTYVGPIVGFEGCLTWKGDVIYYFWQPILTDWQSFTPCNNLQQNIFTQCLDIGLWKCQQNHQRNLEGEKWAWLYFSGAHISETTWSWEQKCVVCSLPS